MKIGSLFLISGFIILTGFSCGKRYMIKPDGDAQTFSERESKIIKDGVKIQVTAKYVNYITIDNLIENKNNHDVLISPDKVILSMGEYGIASLHDIRACANSNRCERLENKKKQIVLSPGSAIKISYDFGT